MKDKLLNKIFSISLKARILREWQKSNQLGEQKFSERELLTLELISDFGPIVEKDLTKLFGISFSTVSDLVGRLVDEHLIEKSDVGRGKPLTLTESGHECLQQIKQTTAARFSYLCEALEDDDKEKLSDLLGKIEENSTKAVLTYVFQRDSVVKTTETQEKSNEGND